MNDASRHLAAEIFGQHLAAKVPIAYPYKGSPPATLVIDGGDPRLTLEIDTDDVVPAAVNALKHVHVSERVRDGIRRLTVTVTGADLMSDGHAMLCAIVDRVQIEGMAPAEAVRETLEQWRSVLAVRARLSPEAEVGLFGELMMLEAFAHALGEHALDAWRGAQREEHDFGLDSLDVEVKTTSTERRAHWISSLTQLRPTPGRPLVLVSLQVTRGGQSGSTLGELVQRLKIRFSAVDTLNNHLEAAEWDDDVADLFVERWALRTLPAVFEVAEGFPAITPEGLKMLGVEQAITEVHYRLDLERREPDTAAGALGTALQLLVQGGQEHHE